ncbi:MAG: hypothetical protein FWD19_01660, partial [Defluviitaleaceae bacterium]|nr:hypothetical protein [Defluviitaleaceae bacterium]
ALCKLCDRIIIAGGIGTSIHAAMGMKNLAMDADNLEKYDEKTDEQIREIIESMIVSREIPE